MSISCGCSYQEGITSVGNPKEVTCRTQRYCNSCQNVILHNDKMYKYNMYNWDDYQTSAPIWICEDCDELAENLTEHGYCFNLGENIKTQWLDYLYDTDPDNPVFNKEIESNVKP